MILCGLQVYVFKMANKFHILYTSAFDYKFFDHLNKYHHVYDIKLRSSDIPENFNNNSISLIKE